MVPPAFVITPSPLGEGRGEINHGNNLGLRSNGRARPSYDLDCADSSLRFAKSGDFAIHSLRGQPDEGDFIIDLIVSHWWLSSVLRVPKPDDSLNSFLITCLRAVLLA